MAAGWNARGRPWRGAPDPEETRLATQLVATLTTSLGDIEVELFPDHAPKTVANFVELAEGTREWTDPQTRSRQQSRLYDGTIFHRVSPGFMIQGGDPLGTGTGGPGYQFKDEIHPDLAFTRPYLLAMANAGPGTNGSQFFITVGSTEWLTGKHTIFGEVISGREVTDAIRATPGRSSSSTSAAPRACQASTRSSAR